MGEFQRSSKRCGFQQLRPELQNAIRAHIRKRRLLLHEVEIVGCCETLSKRRKKSGFFGSFGGAHLLQYVGIVVHPTFLIWAAGHTREKSLPLADVVVSLARLRNVRVREYESRLVEDSGIEVFGFLEDVPQQVSAYIPLDAGAEAQQFLELLLSTANRSIL